MGCVNCKPTQCSPKTSSNGSERPSRAQKTFEKQQRKSFLRAILFTNSKKSKSSSKVAPATTSTQVDSPASNTTTSCSVESLHETFCRSASDTVTFCGEEETPATENDIETIENKDVHSDCTSDSEEEVCEAIDVSEKITGLRKERYRVHAIRSLQEVSTFKDELTALQQSQEENEMELKLLMALKTSALQSPQSVPRLSKLNASIEKLSKTYCQYERDMYMLKGRRAIGEAKVDYFLTKFTPELTYTDIYANNNSFYLSPIPEESDEQIDY